MSGAPRPSMGSRPTSSRTANKRANRRDPRAGSPTSSKPSPPSSLDLGAYATKPDTLPNPEELPMPSFLFGAPSAGPSAPTSPAWGLQAALGIAPHAAYAQPMPAFALSAAHGGR